MRCMTRAFSPTLGSRASGMSRSSMAKPSDEQQKALAGLLGLGNHSTRKSHYPELAARLAELEPARQHLQRLNDQYEQRVAERNDALMVANPNSQQHNPQPDP